jgi:hypothetical protein
VVSPESPSGEKPVLPRPWATVGVVPVGCLGAALIAIVILVEIVMVVYVLVAIWPSSTAAGPVPSHVLGYTFLIDREQRLLLIVALSGALGGLIHSANSFYTYVGERFLFWSWLIMYFFLPFIGSALAIVVYVIIRGGLLSGTGVPAQVNFFGFAAVSALVGMFSRRTIGRLNKLLGSLLSSEESGPEADVRGSQSLGPLPESTSRADSPQGKEQSGE